MPGPNSSPDGDRTLTDNTVIYCKACKTKENSGYFRKRQHLALHKNLRTGKTGR